LGDVPEIKDVTITTDGWGSEGYFTATYVEAAGLEETAPSEDASGAQKPPD
jgi:hypothetical protein